MHSKIFSLNVPFWINDIDGSQRNKNETKNHILPYIYFTCWTFCVFPFEASLIEYFCLFSDSVFAEFLIHILSFGFVLRANMLLCVLSHIEVALNTYRCIWILVCRQKLGTSSHTSKCMGIRITPSQCSPLMLLLVISLFRSNPHTASCCPSLSFILSFYWVYVYVCSTPFQTSAAAFSIKYAGKIACSTWLHLYTLHTTSSIYIYTYV